MPTYGKLPTRASWTSSRRPAGRADLHGRRLRAEQGPAEREIGGDTRFAGTVQLVTLRGLFGLPVGTAARFTNNNGTVHQGGTCFGDSGGPTFYDRTNSWSR